MEEMKDISAKSNSELEDHLSSLDISMPAKTEGRATEHCERWSICRLLATMCANGVLQYPIHLHHRNPDRPDFRLDYGKKAIGIEVTEAVPQNLAAVDAPVERENIKCHIEFPKFKLNEKRKTTHELRDMLASDKLTDPGWGSNGREIGWSRDMCLTCKKKTVKLCNPEYTRFQENWLLIWDELPYIGTNYELAGEYLLEHLNTYWNETEVFSAILIDVGSEIIRITSSGLVKWISSDPWKTT